MSKDENKAENVLNKKEGEMTDVEKMMADIINRNKEEAASSEKPESIGVSPTPPPKNRKVTVPPPDNLKIGASSASRTNREREAKINKIVKRRNDTNKVIILCLCAIIVVGAIVFSTVIRDIRMDNARDEQRVDNAVTDMTDEEMAKYDIEVPENAKIPKPMTEEELERAENGELDYDDGPIVIVSAGEQESTYQIVKDDVSWTDAQILAGNAGGHLATISSQEELDKITEMAEENGIEKLWIGCHRAGGDLVWENGENITFFVWGEGEPSYFDKGDKVDEDYVLLWNHNGKWVYNDSRNDPCKDYPEMYAGKIGYVIEIEN